MIDGLAAILASVDDGAIPAGEPLAARDFGSGPVQVPEELIVLFVSVCNGGDVLAGNDENVHGRLRLEIHEGVALIVLIHRFRRDAPVDDLAEEAAHGLQVYKLMLIGRQSREFTNDPGACAVRRRRESGEWRGQAGD
jgi:hypothetical protein